MLPHSLRDNISIKSTLMPEDWSRDSVLDIVTRLWAGGPGFDSRKAFCSSKLFISVVESIFFSVGIRGG